MAMIVPSRATVVGWGILDSTNDFGQLQIPTNILNGARSVASGGWHGLAITTSSNVVAWGLNDFGQTSYPDGLSNVVSVAAGFDHSLALQADGAVIGWGITSNQFALDPDWFGQADVPDDVTNATAISAGAFHSMALLADGTLRAWGYDFYGQCDVPAGLSNVVSIAAGGYFSLALKSDGTVAAWGDDYYGQTTLPANLTNVVAIAAGGLHGLALKADGTVQGWGARGASDFTQDFGQETPPTDLTNVMSIGAGFFHSLAVQSNGVVRQWGDTSLGQTNPPATLIHALAVAGGYAHSFALKDDHPFILSQPVSVTTLASRATNFGVTVTGITPMRGTWYRSGSTNLASVLFSGNTISSSGTAGTMIASNTTGGIRFSLNLNASYVNVTNATNFFIVLSNSVGIVTSSPAALVILSAPVITSQPASLAGNAGSSAFFSVGVTGTQPFTYQWYYNSVRLGLSNTTNVLELDNITSNNNSGLYRVVISNSVGFTTSTNVTLTVYDTPTILSQPASETVPFGSTATFGATVAGAVPLAYQWYYSPDDNDDFTALGDGTNNNYTVTNAQAYNAGYYYLEVDNGSGSVTSSVVTLTVAGNPTILVQPFNTSILTSNSASFNVVYGGGSPDTFQWYFSPQPTNFTPLADGTGGSYFISSVQTNNAGYYYVIAGNSFGSVTSAVVTLTVLAAPNLLTQPADVFTATNKAVSFSVLANGASPLSGTWYRGGLSTNLGKVTYTGSAVSGSFSGGTINASNSTGGIRFNLNLSAASVNATNATNYFIVLSNVLGVVTSSPAALTILSPPKITNQPASLWTNAGSTVYFNVGASGNQPIIYQWFYNGISLGSVGTNSVLELDAVTPFNNGSYRVVVSNSVGSVTSTNVTLTVYDAPAILVQPANITANFGSNATFTVVAAGSGPLAYQWYFSPDNNDDFLPLADGTNSVYFIPDAEAVSAGYYYIAVSNGSGSADSAVATLTVSGAPSIIAQPTNTIVGVGSNATFTVGFWGGSPQVYQWYFSPAPQTNNFQSLADGTNAAYTITGAQTNNVGYYYLFAGNDFGSVTSRVASLTVLTPPALLNQPASVVIATNIATNFVVAVTGSMPLRGWWYRASNTNSSYTSLGTVLFNNVAASTSCSVGTMTAGLTNGSTRFALNFGNANVTTANSGSYYFVLSNSLGTVTSSVATLSVLIPPRLTFQPRSQSLVLGSTVFFSAGVTGSQPVTYQWYLNGSPFGLTGTSSTNFIELDNVSTNDAGAYSVTVSNPVGSATSSNAILTVITAPVFMVQPSNLAVMLGSNVTFSASVVGAGSITYQWYFSPDDHNDYLPLADGIDSSYTVAGAQTNNAGYYYLLAGNDYGTATSTTAHLNVLYNGASSAPYLYLLGHNPSGDSIMIALESGRNYRVQASADLLTWADVTNFLSHSSLVAFTNSAFSGLPAIYYRAVTP